MTKERRKKTEQRRGEEQKGGGGWGEGKATKWGSIYLK